MVVAVVVDAAIIVMATIAATIEGMKLTVKSASTKVVREVRMAANVGHFHRQGCLEGGPAARLIVTMVFTFSSTCLLH